MTAPALAELRKFRAALERPRIEPTKAAATNPPVFDLAATWLRGVRCVAPEVYHGEVRP